MLGNAIQISWRIILQCFLFFFLSLYLSASFIFVFQGITKHTLNAATISHSSAGLKTRFLKLEGQQNEDAEVVCYKCFEWITFAHVFDREPQGRAQQLLYVSMAT